MRVVPVYVLVATAAMLGFQLNSGRAAAESEITGREAEAIALAVNTFRSSYRKDPKSHGDLKHYSVLIHCQPRQVDIAFIPDRGPRPKDIPKEEEYLDLSRCTPYGCEVHYIIRLDRMKIIDVHY